MRKLPSLRKTGGRNPMMLMPANASNSLVHYLAGRHPGKIGWLVGPSARSKTKLRPWMPYALDNDAFGSFSGGHEWSESEWLEMLKWARSSAITPMWSLVPDVVADKKATLAKWDQYAGTVDRFGFAKAFAVQDGMVPSDVPVGASVVFVGGTTEWKWRTLPMWSSAFPRVHVGRVNELRRLWTCEDFGVESVDGAGWFRGTQDGRQGRAIQAWIEGYRDSTGKLFEQTA